VTDYKDGDRVVFSQERNTDTIVHSYPGAAPMPIPLRKGDQAVVIKAVLTGWAKGYMAVRFDGHTKDVAIEASYVKKLEVKAVTKKEVAPATPIAKQPLEFNGKAFGESLKKMAAGAMSDIQEMNAVQPGEEKDRPKKRADFAELAEARRIACAQWARGHVRTLDAVCPQDRTSMGLNARYHDNDIRRALMIVSACAQDHEGEVLVTNIDPRQFEVTVRA
jgi:hypothetical protein